MKSQLIHAKLTTLTLSVCISALARDDVLRNNNQAIFCAKVEKNTEMCPERPVCIYGYLAKCIREARIASTSHDDRTVLRYSRIIRLRSRLLLAMRAQTGTLVLSGALTDQIQHQSELGLGSQKLNI